MSDCVKNREHLEGGEKYVLSNPHRFFLIDLCRQLYFNNFLTFLSLSCLKTPLPLFFQNVFLHSHYFIFFIVFPFIPRNSALKSCNYADFDLLLGDRVVIDNAVCSTATIVKVNPARKSVIFFPLELLFFM